MARRPWYDDGAIESVKVVARAGSGPRVGPSRRRHARTRPGLGECLLYPVTDGPGVAMLAFMPVALFFLSLPIFDLIALVDPFTRGRWALGLLALPIFLPLMTIFALVFGYTLLVFGHMFVASAMGEPEHPDWPAWDSHEIAEGLGRWLWAGIFGVSLGGFPVLVYWKWCGHIDGLDRVVFLDLAFVGAGYALMALAASLLHDTVLAANPVTVLSSIYRVGWDYVMPGLTAGLAVCFTFAALWAMLFQMPSPKVACLALWAFWVVVMYQSMVVFRMMGLTYHAHAAELAWFRERPRWGNPFRVGKIYVNS